MNKPKVSIIMPVYNVENYLSKCIESLINQTYKNLEIICINDGSTDNSAEMLKKYIQIDSRIKFINQANGGLADARNTGLKMATGDYIYFVDSDDWIKETLIEKAVAVAEENNSDIILFDVINFYNGSYLYVNRTKDFIKKYKLINFNFNDEKNIMYHTPTAWSKLYRHSFLSKNNLFFPKSLSFGEDSPFWIFSLLCNPKITMLPENLYYYRKRGNSISAEISPDIINKQWLVYEYITNSEIYTNLDKEYKLLILDFICRLAVNVYSQVINSYKLIFPFEKSIHLFEQEYCKFKKHNLLLMRGYRFLLFRHLYALLKRLYLLIKT